MLCDAPPLPPASIYQSQDTSSDTCQGCHKYINPIGYGLNHFDSLVAYRTTDASGNVINAMGSFFEGPSFNGAEDMIATLKNNTRVGACSLRKFYGYAHARIPHSKDDEAYIEDLHQKWQDAGLGMGDLIQLLVISPSFTHRYRPAID